MEDGNVFWVQIAPYIGTIIGGIIGFTSSIGVLIITRALDRRGKLQIFCKRTNDGDFPWGFHRDKTGQISFIVPLDFELMNTSNTTRAVRDVQMLLYNKKKQVVRMVQIDKATSTTKKNNVVSKVDEHAFGAKNNSYSFVLPPRSIQKVKCEYMLLSPSGSNEITFDELRIAYYSENNKLINKHLCWYRGDWSARKEPADQEWIMLK